tara:strand:- start:703 stop:966 length:264 start_codon:yes stop_codon:yes gene_type:complete
MTRLKNLMSEYKLLKIKVRLEQNEEKRSRLVASLLSVRGQFKEHNLMLIKKRKYSEQWRAKNKRKITDYNKMYARMRRARIRDEQNI